VRAVHGNESSRVDRAFDDERREEREKRRKEDETAFQHREKPRNHVQEIRLDEQPDRGERGRKRRPPRLARVNDAHGGDRCADQDNDPFRLDGRGVEGEVRVYGGDAG